MTLYSNWKTIVRKAWSVRMMLIAGLLTGCEAVINAYGADWLPVPTWARLLLILVVIGGAFISRITAQKALPE